jgi:hypothetical protein
MLQDYCRRLGIGTSDQEIRDLIATLEPLPQSHPLVPLLKGSRDARNADALADALLNPRDRSYSVPQLFEFLERTGLRMGRWYWQAPYLPQCGAIAATPHAKRLAALPELEQAAAMELWRGTMATHSVIAQRADVSRKAAIVRFDDERWPGYVPVRMPWTLCVRDRVPAGAAGVLLNQSHTHPDLILVIDALEKRIFDAIDGHLSIAEILERTHGDQARPRARTFFEKLWWYDQVVFETTRMD